ncbi:uncharacterized protein LOC133180914 [Saccostrea echinata]|uniref:uncharacterized protein LOC133180914 n=1 Tax=Saccostrea echinata TaxID=191078 RepID=UPI002A7EB266|nr:uncharacterized protein LOC133180914 [Saccostrea echinata]XP_061171351.1 uncharacterized protein LOC133180914 [Saccostrea echinata]
MPRLVLLFVLGLLLVSHIDGQKSKRKSKFKALLPVFEPPKPKTNSIAEKPKTTGTASSSTIETVATIEIGKEKPSQPSNPSKMDLPPEPSKPVQEPKAIIQSPPSNQNQIAKKNVKASPYSLFPEGIPQNKRSNTPVQQYKPPTRAFSMKKTKQSSKSAPSKPRLGNANFFGFKPMTSSTPTPTTPAPPPPVQQSLFNFFSGQNGPSPTQQAIPFPLPSMPPYPGLPNNNPQLKNVYRMIATWLVSHAMNGNNNAAPRPVTTTKQTPPTPPMRLPNTQRQQQQQRRHNLLTPPPQRNRKQMKASKRSQKKTQTQRNKKQEEALRRMREKAYREYMDEVFDVDVPDTAFANGRIPSFQAPSFEFPW